jgi:hypothetical protein
MPKNGLIFVGILAGVISIGIYFTSKTEETKIQAGLEECLMDPHALIRRTIWVKDCRKYLETVEKALGTDN